MKRLYLALFVILMAVITTGRADTELLLFDGRTIAGVEVRREGDFYYVMQDGGGAVAVPAVMVKEVRLIDVADDDRPTPAPSGLQVSEPQQLAGPETRPPTPQEATEVFGDEAKWQQSMFDENWTPSSDWDMDPVKNNNFAPSTWAKGPIDPTWEPESAFDANEDVLKDSRSTWQDSIIDNEWTPTDGFKKS